MTAKQVTQSRNHPRKGSSILVDPIRSKSDLKLIRALLADKPRDLCLFTFGINSNLRASDLLQIRVGQVRDLKAGEWFTIREQKTNKSRQVTVNAPMAEAIKRLLATMPAAQDGDLLFQSRTKAPRNAVTKHLKRRGTVVRQPLPGEITVPHLTRMVKGWCRAAKIKGNYGAHSLRKCWGYMMRTEHNAPVYLLSRAFNHSSEQVTMRYLGITQQEVTDLFLHAI